MLIIVKFKTIEFYSIKLSILNPLDKFVELYERLVLAEKEKVEYLEKLLKGK